MFAPYYVGPYVSDMRMTLEDCAEFLKDITLHQLTVEERDAHEADLTEEELVAALQCLQSDQQDPAYRLNKSIMRRGGPEALLGDT
ncbi:hypothetical protein NDU88_003254 [Pleurodeles waltl]|uniref:Uncharacterized protein n=1 Tax=Pleurodeles waltl TaxID=8319 RepID=A0AAV7M4N9_PLEWA|nr:hypothetical protein NDU88_003254 [Pleurodeles waltl]